MASVFFVVLTCAAWDCKAAIDTTKPGALYIVPCLLVKHRSIAAVYPFPPMMELAV